MRSEGWFPYDGISALIRRRDRRAPFYQSVHPEERSDENAERKQSSVSQEDDLQQEPNMPTSGKVRNKCVLFKF